MSYRLLLAGKKQDIIDNFFQMAGEKYEIHPGIKAVLMMGSASGHIL